MTALPQWEGPKLRPFRTQDGKAPAITYLEVIGHGAHSHVLKVSIDGKIYCLKAFKFLHPNKYRPHSIPRHTYSEEGLVATGDPFYSECRAYGRLEEEGKEALAARCYGYVMLTRRDEALLREKFPYLGWDRSKGDGRRHVRAILKELINAPEAFLPEQAPRMKSDLLGMHRIGIMVEDLKEDQYVGGKLVDFSQAYTLPHFLIGVPGGRGRDKWTTSKYMAQDNRDSFDTMLAEWQERHPDAKIWEFFGPSGEWTSRLRPNSIRPDAFEVYVDPGNYDWTKAKLRWRRQRRKAGG